MDAESPYVFDPYYFVNDSGAYVYEGSYPARVHKSVHLLAFISGIVPCSIFLYLVLCRTPEYLKKFSRILLICAVSDILFLIFNFCFQLRVQNNNGIMLAAITGPFKDLTYLGHCYAAAVGTMTKIVSYVILPIQFHYRLMLLKSNNSSFVSLFLCYLLLIAIAAVLSGLTASSAFCTYENPLKIDYAKYWYKEIPVPNLAVAPGNYMPAKMFHVLFGFATFGTYLVVLLFVYLTFKHIRLNADRLSPKTLNLQKQFSRALLMQASIPLILVVIPTFVKIFGVLTQTKLETIEPITNMIMVFLPLLNSLSSLVFISHYRRECTRIFCCNNNANAELSVRPRNEPTITHVQIQGQGTLSGRF